MTCLCLNSTHISTILDKYIITKSMKPVLFTTALLAIAKAKDDTGDSKRNFSEICVENGFAFEEHTVVTEDGYILSQWRIPGQINETAKDKPVVFF